MEHMGFNKWIVIMFIVSMFGVLAVAVFAGANVFTGLAEANANESASLRLASTGRVVPQLKAFARLQLSDNQGGGHRLQAAARVESDGLTENRLYDLWLNTPEGSSVLVDTGRADQEFHGGSPGDSEIVVNLRGQGLAAPSDLTTLEGVRISIREHASFGLFDGGTPVLASGTVTAGDLN